MIEVRDLVKRYGSHTAVDGISFTIEPGRIYGFLGPNGAGKSTTMNIMTGCLAASEGEVKLNGYDIVKEPEKAKQGVGYLPEQPPLYFDMTPMEYLRFVGQVKGLKGEALAQQVNAVMERTGLTDYASRMIKNLSKGYKQRVGIAQAILGDPQLIILDEPTVGLDPAQIVEIRELIKELGKNHTVILSSHILSEVRAVCDHIIMISHGRLAASGTTREILGMFRGSCRMSLTLRGDEGKIRAALEKIEGVDSLTVSAGENGEISAALSHDSELDLREAVFKALVGAGCVILEMTSSTASLEDVFMELTAGDPEDPEEKEGEEE